MIGLWLWLAVSSPAATQPDVSATVEMIEKFAAAQRDVDRAWLAVRRAVARDPALIETKLAFERAKQEVVRLRFRGSTEQLQAASEKYLAAKKAIAAAEPLAAPQERAELKAQEAKLDALRNPQRAAHDNPTNSAASSH